MNKYFEDCFTVAWKTAEKSPCLKKQVGAVLFDMEHKRIVGRGYGGANHTCVTCIRKTVEWKQDGCWSVHAEMRALFNFIEEHGYKEDMSDYIMFTTHGPCDQCLKYMELFKIPVVMYDKPYDNDYSKWGDRINVVSKEELMK